MRAICKNVNYSCALVINQQNSASLIDCQNTNYSVEVNVIMCNSSVKAFAKLNTCLIICIYFILRLPPPFSLNQVNFIGQNTSKKYLKKICPFEKLFKEKTKYPMILCKE